MEDTHATVVPASRTGHLHISHGNRLHVRVSVHGNELELTDERADNKTASTNIQELISAFARALKATGNNTPVATHFVTENPQSSSICTENPEFKSEVMRLQQRVQKFEGEVMHLRQLLQNSKEENEVQKVRFRAVTHMKAEELAHKLSKINIVHNATDGHGLEGTSGLAEPFTPEQGPTEFVLNPKVKEIDFLSLDDILGKDNASDLSSKRTDENMPMGDSKVITNNSGSVLGTISDYDGKYLDVPSTQTIELPKAPPPSVLKVSLDVELARAGGECKVQNSQGSPLCRSPRRRARSNNNDSQAEWENAMQTDEDFAGPNNRSTAGTYSLMYKPSPDDGSYCKAVYIGNLPQDIDYQKLLAKVRGGRIISATLCNTTKIKGYFGRMSALVVFLDADSAWAYVQFANKHGICFDSQKAVIRFIETPTFPLSLQAKRRIEVGHTRYLMMKKESSELSLKRIDHVINAGANKYRVDAMERFWKDEDGNVRICFASISAASMAFWRLSTDSYYDSLEFQFKEDPCGRPLSDLLPLPTGRRVSDFVEMKVNYDDDDDSEDKYTKEVKLVNSLMRSMVSNPGEIELGDGDVESCIGDNKAVETETAKDSKDVDELKLDLDEVFDKAEATNQGNAVNDPKIFVVADMAKMADNESTQNESAKESSNSTSPDTSKAGVLTSTEDNHRLQNFSDAEKSLIVEDVTMLESVTSLPIVLQLPSSISSEPLPITSIIPSVVADSLDPWADDVNRAVEAGTLEPLVDLSSVPAPETLIDVDGDSVDQAIHFLSRVTEEDIRICEPIEEEPVNETLMETLVAEFPIEGLPITKAPVVELSIIHTSVKESSTTTAPAKPSSAMTSPVEARGKSVVKLPSSIDTTIPDKFSLAGTDLDPVLLPRYVFDKVLSEKPRGGLSSSRWASLKTNATAPIIIEAPLAVPTLADAIKPAAEFLFGTLPSAKPASAQQPVSLAPASAPEGPRAGVPSSRPVNLESDHKSLAKDQLARIQKTLSTQSTQAAKAAENETAPVPKPLPTGPKSMPCRPHSRYSSLDLDTARPWSSLRNFYAAVDLQTAALKKPDAAVQNADGPTPVTH